ncbi:phospholipid phosphatase 1-like [Glandiceps talaboti]
MATFKSMLLTGIVNFCMFLIAVLPAWHMDEIAAFAFPNRTSGMVFDLTDAKIGYPYKNSIRWGTLLKYVTIVTISSMVIGEASTIFTKKRSVGGAVSSFCTTLFNYLFVSCYLRIFVVVPKAMVVKPRPHFLESCNPDLTGLLPNQTVIGFDRCTTTAKIIADGSDSWPSGHAALAFHCGIFLLFYLNARLPKNSPKFLTAITQSLCVLVPYYVGLTRIQDMRHFVEDVIMGSVIGILLGVWTADICGLVRGNGTPEPTAVAYSATNSIPGTTRLNSNAHNGVLKRD